MIYKLIVVQAFCIVSRILWHHVVNYCLLKIRNICLVNYSRQNRNAKLSYVGLVQVLIFDRHRSVSLQQPVRTTSGAQSAVRRASWNTFAGYSGQSLTATMPLLSDESVEAWRLISMLAYIFTAWRWGGGQTRHFKEVFIMGMSRPYSREAYRIHFFDWHMDWFHETQNTQHRIYFCHVQYLLIRECPFFGRGSWDYHDRSRCERQAL
jgi:hypothetical protein